MTRRIRLKARRIPKGDMMPDDSSKLMRQVILDPTAAAEAARERYVKSEDNWRQEKYQALAMVYALGVFLKYHGSAWRKFSRNPFFDFRKRPLRPIKDQPKAMRYAAYFVLNAHNEPKRDRAAAYVRGLQVLARRGVRADDVVDEIVRAGGIEALAEAAKTDPTRPQRYEKPKAAEQPDYYDVSGESDVGDEDSLFSAAVDAEQPSRPEGKTSETAKVGFERGYDPKGRPTVEFETETEERQEWFLDLRKRRSAWVLVESLGRSKDGWRRLKIKQVDPERGA